MSGHARNVVVLAGGVGGAKLVEGLAGAIPAEQLTVIVNTGDDFTHLGLRICPDLDTILYTLAGVADRERGWGLADETFHALAEVGRYGGPTWFRLGDRDLGTHLQRTAALLDGERLTDITRALAEARGVGVRILPMCDEPRTTVLDCADGRTLDFQEWLVRERAVPAVQRVRFEGSAHPSADVLLALREADSVVLAPSNPYVSIDPILSLAHVRDAIAKKPVVAVSPIVAGAAVKGPLAAMIPALAARRASAAAIVAHYGSLLRGIVVEEGDRGDIEIPVLETSTVMRTVDDRRRLAQETLAFTARL